MLPLIKFIGLSGRREKSNISFHVSLISVIVGLFSLNALDMFSIGFKQKVANKLSYLDGHLKIKKIGSTFSYNEYNDINKKINQSYQAFPYTKKSIIIRENKDIKNMILISVPLEYFNNSNEIDFDIVEAKSNGSIILSKSLLKKLNLKVNENCNIYELDLEKFSDLKPNRVPILGTFNSDFKEYDDKVAFTLINNIEKQNFSGILVNTSNPLNVENDIKSISGILNNDEYRYITWKTQHFSFIEWLELYHIPIKIIIFLITMVSSFSITTSLYLFIDEKKYHISLLRSIGYSMKMIRFILLKIVLLLSLIGVIAANMLTIILYLAQSKYGFISLPPDIYFMSKLPVDFSLYYFTQNNIVILAMIVIFSIYPIINAKKIIPTSLRKYELV